MTKKEKQILEKNGFSGVPEIGTLWKDQLWKKDLLEKINKEFNQ